MSTLPTLCITEKLEWVHMGSHTLVQVLLGEADVCAGYGQAYPPGTTTHWTNESLGTLTLWVGIAQGYTSVVLHYICNAGINLYHKTLLGFFERYLYSHIQNLTHGQHQFGGGATLSQFKLF